MKVPVGFPFDNPGTQKVTSKERGDYFAPTGGVDKEIAGKEYTKPQKIVKVIGAVLIGAVLVGLIIWAILDPGPIPNLYEIG